MAGRPGTSPPRDATPGRHARPCVPLPKPPRARRRPRGPCPSRGAGALAPRVARRGSARPGGEGDGGSGSPTPATRPPGRRRDAGGDALSPEIAGPLSPGAPGPALARDGPAARPGACGGAPRGPRAAAAAAAAKPGRARGRGPGRPRDAGGDPLRPDIARPSPPGAPAPRGARPALPGAVPRRAPGASGGAPRGTGARTPRSRLRSRPQRPPEPVPSRPLSL